jgi:hypothetical protein
MMKRESGGIQNSETDFPGDVNGRTLNNIGSKKMQNVEKVRRIWVCFSPK